MIQTMIQTSPITMPLPMAMKEQILHTSEGGIVYEPSLLSKPAHAMFEPSYWTREQVNAAVPGGRGSVVFIANGGEHGAGPWVLRHYRRGGLMAKLLEDRYLWRGADATRSFREWRLLRVLHAQQLPVPVPVAARYVRPGELSGLLYRADLLTAEIPGALTLAQRLRESALEPKAWQALGGVIARFHRAGVQHADLNAHNILFDAEQHIHVIDFDRGRLRQPGPWHEAVLARLLRSLQKIKVQQGIRFEAADWSELLKAHRAGMSIQSR